MLGSARIHPGLMSHSGRRIVLFPAPLCQLVSRINPNRGLTVGSSGLGGTGFTAWKNPVNQPVQHQNSSEPSKQPDEAGEYQAVCT
jgi:hypothetical protein